ncbi:MAG: dihydrofolate reductase [Patescibacteria group bacterium]|nr:dihydrofolate reductase [Patescibacteria group bacterium]MDD5716090.1 dihydrofolate reductase [Patescibacteria group bacterium]
MFQPRISIIAALSENRAIGKDNRLLWHIAKDLHRFRQLTAGHAVIMGRKTFESMGKALPNRTNIVISRKESFKAPGCTTVTSLERALEEAKRIEHNEIFIIGGGEIYRQVLPITDKLYLTVIKGTFDADTFFPDYSMFTNVVKKEEAQEGERSFVFLELTR